jgi:Zn-dependent protease with chaperone function
MGANAFALPSGDVVILDELILLDKNKNLYGVLGVLAHEKGHVVYRHALKGAIKTTVATAVIGYFTGDATFIASTLPTLLVTTKYSREFEHEADVYAKNELKKLNISSKPLAELFKRLENYTIPSKEKNNTKKDDNFNIDIPEWVSTHPATEDRIEFFMRD